MCHGVRPRRGQGVEAAEALHYYHGKWRPMTCAEPSVRFPSGIIMVNPRLAAIITSSCFCFQVLTSTVVITPIAMALRQVCGGIFTCYRTRLIHISGPPDNGRRFVGAIFTCHNTAYFYVPLHEVYYVSPHGALAWRDTGTGCLCTTACLSVGRTAG